MLGSVRNAFRVLELLCDHDEMGISEIGRELKLAPATAYRLTNSLLDAGFAEQDPVTRRYRVGRRLITLANKLRQRGGLRELLLPLLEETTQQTHETVNLGVYHQGEVVYLEKIDSPEIFRIQVDVGARVPAYCSAMGKVLLAFREHDEINRYLSSTDLISHTQNTITASAKILAELQRIRKRGYALDKGELMEDIWCVAAPVFDDGRVVAALSVSALRSRFEQNRAGVIAAVTEAARRASAVVSGDLEPSSQTSA